MGFDKEVSLASFKNTLYPVLRKNCSGCHSTEIKSGYGAQAPLHSDVDPVLAHEYALTRVNFRDIPNSKLVFRMVVDRHNCFAADCKAAGKELENAIKAWYNGVQGMVLEAPRSVEAGTKVTDAEVQAWIDADKAKTAAADKEFIQYASFHVLHNEGVSAHNLNLARVGLSKALNTAARWAPEIVNPADVNGKGMVYRFDIRDYWGHTLIDTSASNFALFYGGSDDDLAFEQKIDLNGKSVGYNDLATMKNKLKSSVSKDEKFARLVWARVLKGNAEGAGADNKSLPPQINGFVGTRSKGGNNQDYIKPADFKYVEAAQLTYTLTRPDVYNSIMALPGYSHFLEDELGVDKSKGVDSFDLVLTQEAITIESRMYWRAKQKTGRGNYYWKTWDIFAAGNVDVDKQVAQGNVRFPFWANPIPKFISTQQGGTTPDKLAMIATVYLFDGQGDNGGGYYSGKDGGQQSAEEVIWSLPNGLQGYALFGGFNQRRVDAFVHIVRDPRIQLTVADDILDNYAGKALDKGVKDVRLNNASSCIGCHSDGMNRGNNDLRDYMDENPEALPKGKYGVDGWIKDAAKVARVKELYKPSKVIREHMEGDRKVFLEAAGKINKGMIIGTDKNTYTEPTIWTIEWARKFYKFPVTRSS
ncbi:MAG: hypothetical protein RL497_2169 [Pseudomonadota bacterium]|jgi:hypothetical protein